MRVDVRLLGGFEVLVDGVRRPDDAWSRQAPAALVKLLALTEGHRLRREQVIDALWPDLLVDRAAPRLHKAAHYARTALDTGDGLVLAGDAVSLFPAAEVVVDVERFESAVESARAGSADAAAEAVDLYRGDLLPDELYEAWTEEARERLRLAYAEMLHLLGRWDAILAADPTDEEAHLALVRGHVDRGDRRAALRQLETMERVWEREFGQGLGTAARELLREVVELPEEPGGLRSVSAPVPTPATRTVGRDDEIARVAELLESARAVTLLGPGGVGKTRLAAEVALRRAGAARFVDLTKVSDPDLVAGLVARELGVRVEAGADATRAVVEVLGHRPVLLVLDNFEHVLDAADLVPRLVQAAPAVQVLSTSRARLRVAGEQVFDVLPLSLDLKEGAAEPPDAITLFTQVATAVDPGFDLDRHLSDVVSICRAVDGLPLAIELAAGHVRTLSPPLLLARLGARLGSTSGASRGTPARQQTVPATIDWSLRLVGEHERDLFVLLGVFAGAVPLEAVEQVCGQPGTDVVDLLSRLVDHSLVRRVTDTQGEPRFVLLELLRERARELLDEEPGLAEDAARRHAAYLADYLDDLDVRRWREASATWIEDITLLLTEIRAAHPWAVAHGEIETATRLTVGLGTYWHREGHHAEGRQWVQEALEHEESLDETLRARLHLTAGFVEWSRDQHVGRRHWTEASDRFRSLGDDRYLAYALGLASGTYTGDREGYEVALAMCEEALALAREVGDQPLLAQVLNLLGELTRVQGDDERAQAAYTEGLVAARAAGDETHVAMLVGNLSFIADHRGDHAEARRLSLEALRRSWAIGRRLVVAMAISQLAGAELGLGRPEQGAVLMGASDEAFRRLAVAPHLGDKPELERVVTGLRAELGDARYEQLWADGARLSLHEAVDLALAGGDEQPDAVT
ncbi:MAG: tetratricopeptide repeat protein [Marmoricola sp.]